MNPSDLVQQLFQLDKNIRWVGILDQQGKIVQNAQRPGVESYADPATDELTIREFPTIMGLLWGRLVGQSGNLNSVVVSYSRVYLMAFYVDDNLVILSFEPEGMPEVTRKLESKYGPIMPTSMPLDTGTE